MKALVTLALFALAGCSAQHTNKATGIRFVTFTDWLAPSVTCIETAPGVWHVVTGSSIVGQLAGPGAVAASGVLIGEGLEKGGDTIDVAGGTAVGGNAVSNASIDIDVPQPKR